MKFGHILLLIVSMTAQAQLLEEPRQVHPSRKFELVLPQETMRYREVNWNGIKFTYDTDGQFYTSTITYERLRMDGRLYRSEISPTTFIGSHMHAIELFNFSMNEWVEASLVTSDTILLDNTDIHISHKPGMNFKGKKSEFYISVGPKYRFNEFVFDGAAGAAVTMRLRLD